MKLNPETMVSLWEMLQFYADKFVEVTTLLAKVRVSNQLIGPVIATQPDVTAVGGQYLAQLKELRDQLDSIGLAASAKAAERLVTINQPGHRYDYATVSSLSQDLELRIKDELAGKFFLYLDENEALQFCNPMQKEMPIITQKLPKAVEDLREALKCFALGRYTACVFHNMRAMEYGIQKMGKKLKLQLNATNETWYQIGQAIDNAIKVLPAKTEFEKRRKQKLAEASANLNAVRIAWRNDVMHPKATYTEDEAGNIMNYVAAFMVSLSALV